MIIFPWDLLATNTPRLDNKSVRFSIAPKLKGNNRKPRYKAL